MMIDIKSLKADREAGTDGRWLAIKYFGDKDGWFVRSQDQESICGKGSTELSEANASRIARLPELEDAYIEVVAKLNKAVDALQEILSRRQYRIDSYHRNGPQWTTEAGNEYESTDDVISSCKEDVRYLETALGNKGVTND